MDTKNVLHEDVLSILCQKVRPTIVPEKESDPEEVEDVTDQDDEVIEEDVAYTMADALILAAQSSSEFISALDVYDRLEDQAYDTWLLTLINVIEALPDHQREGLLVKFVEKADETFPHNYEVLDIQVKSNAEISL